MLKAAEDALAVHSADDLQGLLNTYKKDYDSANILNDVDDINDFIYDEDSYADFEYEYENAESVVDGSDKKAITDAYEELEQAHDALKALPSVTKADFAREIARLQQAQKKEFDYHAWQRGTVSGTGTDYDGQTVAWGVLFYHVWSAFDAINEQFGTIKDVKTLNRTTNDEVVKAYTACQQAVKVLNGFTPAKTKSYRNEESVTNLVYKTYKNKLLANDAFVKQLLTETVSGTVTDIYLDAENTVALSTVWTGTDWVSGKGASDIVKKGKITLYGAADTSSGKGLEVESSSHLIQAVSSTGGESSIEIFSVDDENFANDLIQILGKMDEPDKQLNTIWDGNNAFNKTATLGDDEKLAELATVKIVAGTAATNTGSFTPATWTVTGTSALDGTNGPKFSTASSGSAGVSKSADIAKVLLSPTIEAALDALNGESYDGSSPIEAGTLAGKDAGEKKTAEQTIISSKAVDLDKLDDEKVSTNEWTAIGNFLDCALSEWLDEPATVSYTVAEADKLIDDSDEVLEITAQAAVFATLNDALVNTRDLLLEDANANRRTTAKKVTKETYENCKKAFDNLKKALDGFKYSYEDVQKTLADVAKQLDDSSSALHGDATVAQDMKDVAKYFIKVSDLATNGDDMIDDVVNDSYEFAGYNRVYTAEGETDVGDGIKISKAKDGANKAHYELTTAYEKLLADYRKATETAGKDVNYDVDGDKTVNANDVIEFSKKLANEETLDVAVYDFNGDGKVDVNDPAKLLDLILNEQV